MRRHIHKSFRWTQSIFAAVIAAAALLAAPSALAIDLAQNYHFDGVLVNDTTGVPLTGPVAVRFQVYDPSGGCLLFDETHASVALDSEGAFSVKVGGGARVSPGLDGGLYLKQIYQNAGQVRAPGGTNCSPGYTPATNDARRLRVIVNGTPLTPDYTVSPMPMASVAESLQGKTPSDFVSSTGATSLAGPMTLNTQGEVRFGSASANYVSVKSPATVPVSVILTLPNNDGTAGDCLTTDGNGVLSWSTCAGGGGAPSGPAGGALGGTYPNPTLAVAFAGDVSGSFSSMSVDKLKTYSISPAAPTANQVLKYTGGLWTPSTFPDFSTGGSMTGMLTISTGGLTATGSANVSVPNGSAAIPAVKIGSTGYGLYYTGAPQGLHVAAGATSRLFVDGSNGNVGIGTTSPISTLEVNGTATIATDLEVGGAVRPYASGVGNPAINFGGSGDGLFYTPGVKMGFATSGSLERLTVDLSTGRVGIGVPNPVADLDIAGTMRLPTNATQPISCTAPVNGMIALTSQYTLCVCKNGPGWVKTTDGTTACVW